MLETMDTWIGKIPPINQPQRFGNKAFRTWCGKLEEVRQDEAYKLTNSKGTSLWDTVRPKLHASRQLVTVLAMDKDWLFNVKQTPLSSGHFLILFES